MTAPNPPPRGGAEPRVSAETLAYDLRGCPNTWIVRYASDLRDARAEIADLRDKLEAAEAERDAAREIVNHGQTSIAAETERWKCAFSVERARAEAAEAALREMTEQRDGAWKAGRDAAVADVDALQKIWEKGIGLGREINALDEVIVWLRALAPPAETAARLAGPSPNVGGGGAK